MTAPRQCEFQILRYVPDPVRNEFVNIGVLVREADSPAPQMHLRMTRDWQRVRCMNPDADTALFEALEEELQQRLNETPAEGIRPLIRVLDDSFSNAIQLTPAKAMLAESLLAGVEELMQLYVENRKREKTVRRSGRAALLSSMRSHFERAGVWALMRKRIAASDYTRPGDPLRLDCGYRPNGVVRIFHAVSLEGDIEMAKVLAFSAPALAAGLERVEGAKLELTAIVEPLLWEQKDEEPAEAKSDPYEQYRFAVETMEERSIRVLTSNDLARVAERARQELKL
jgi:hypothetical protein